MAGVQTASDFYYNGTAGLFQSNYFERNLEHRGLLNSRTGPALRHFPYYEDALPIHRAQQLFMQLFVDSYYGCDDDVLADGELQAWVDETNGPANVRDFPDRSEMSSRSALVDVLTQVAHLVSTAHHTVNLNQILDSAALLPLNPLAIFKPPPTSKGIPNVVDFLPPFDDAIRALTGAAAFARPSLAGTERTLVHMFDDPVMLARMNSVTREANQEFMRAMKARSRVVSKRSYNAAGLSQGMPFIWEALNPEIIPWSTTI